MNQPLVKRPGEVRTYAVNFGNQPEIRDQALTIASGTASIDSITPAINTSSPITLGAVTVSGSKLVCDISSGLDATDYLIKFDATLSNGKILEEYVTIQVRKA